MSKIKRNLSRKLSETLEAVLPEYLPIIKIKQKDGFDIYLIDSDVTSDFYFGITKETVDSSAHHIHYVCKPNNAASKIAMTSACRLPDLTEILKNWLSNVKYYQTDSVLDDPILIDYENEFYAYFKVDDDDADLKPFSYDHQLRLNQLLENIVNNIDDIKDDNNEDVIDDIKDDAKSLQLSITSEAKNKIMKRLSKILAKSRKAGFKTFNFMIEELKKEIVRFTVKEGFNFVVNNISDIQHLPSYIHRLIS